MLRTAKLANQHCDFCLALLISYSMSPSLFISIICCQLSDCKSNMSMVRDVLSWDFKNNDIILTNVKRTVPTQKHIQSCTSVLPGCCYSPSSGWCIKMPALKIFFFVFPRMFPGKKLTIKKVQNKPRSLTLAITGGLNEISVRAHPQAPSSAQHCGPRTLPDTLDLFVLTTFLRSTFLKGRKLVFLYLLWMGYFLPIYNPLEMLL